MSEIQHILKSEREQEAAFIEADILSNLNLASGFANLAAGHADLFDEAGFRYSCDQFITHAKAVAEKLKALRSLGASKRPSMRPQPSASKGGGPVTATD